MSDNSLEYGIRLSNGDIPGYSYIHKFGQNPSVTTDLETIWSYGGLYTYSSNSGVELHISSDNSNDTMEITIEGLDQNFNLQTKTVTLQGLTETTISGTWTRVFRAYNSSGTNLTGNVYIYEDDTVTLGVPDTASKVRAYIGATPQQTQLAIYTVPANKKGFVFRANMSSGRNVDVDFFLYTRAFGGVFRLAYEWGIYRNNIVDNTMVPLVLPAKTDIEFRASTPTGTASNVTSGFSIILVDEYQDG